MSPYWPYSPSPFFPPGNAPNTPGKPISSGPAAISLGQLYKVLHEAQHLAEVGRVRTTKFIRRGGRNAPISSLPFVLGKKEKDTFPVKSKGVKTGSLSRKSKAQLLRQAH